MTRKPSLLALASSRLALANSEVYFARSCGKISLNHLNFFFLILYFLYIFPNNVGFILVLGNCLLKAVHRSLRDSPIYDLRVWTLRSHFSSWSLTYRMPKLVLLGIYLMCSNHLRKDNFSTLSFSNLSKHSFLIWELEQPKISPKVLYVANAVWLAWSTWRP